LLRLLTAVFGTFLPLPTAPSNVGYRG